MANTAVPSEHDPMPDEAAVASDHPSGPVRGHRFRGALEWAAIALLAAAVVIGCTKAAETTTAGGGGNGATNASELEGPLGETVDRVVGGLDAKQKECIEKAADPVAAAQTCVDREVLADQVVAYIKAMNLDSLSSSSSKSSMDDLYKCIETGIEDLSNKDIADLVAGDTESDGMKNLSDSISKCSKSSSSSSASSKFSSVGSAIS